MGSNANSNNKLSHNPTVAAVAGGVVGALLGALLTLLMKDYQYHDAVTYNNISSYIRSELVNPGYVSEEILEKENPFEQIEMIRDTISEKDLQSDNFYNAIREFLIAFGEKESDVNKYSASELIASLTNAATKMQDIERANSSLSTELEELQSQVLAKLITPKAYILGEPSDTTIKDYLAIINTHNYYSEEFLNSFLSYPLQYEENTIYYNKEAPEKVNIISANLTFDVYGFDLYNGDSHFTMGLQDYNNGIRTKYNNEHSLKVACNGNYSKITFTLGHVDEGRRDGKELIVYYLDNNGEYKEAETISLFSDMPVESYSIPIYNTRTVKIVISNGYYGDYALTDVYLVK